MKSATSIYCKNLWYNIHVEFSVLLKKINENDVSKHFIFTVVCGLFML